MPDFLVTAEVGGTRHFRVLCDRFYICDGEGDACIFCCDGDPNIDHVYWVALPCGDIDVTFDNFSTYLVNHPSCVENVPSECGMCDNLNDTFTVERDANCGLWVKEFRDIDYDAVTCEHYLTVKVTLSLHCCTWNDGTDWHHKVYWLGELEWGYNTVADQPLGLGTTWYQNVFFVKEVADTTDTGCDFIDLRTLDDELEVRAPGSPAEPANENEEKCFGGGAVWTHPTFITCANYPTNACHTGWGQMAIANA